MGIRELYSKEKKRRQTRRITLFSSLLIISIASFAIYLNREEIKTAFESDANPIQFLAKNGQLPDSGIWSDDNRIPKLLRSKSNLPPFHYHLSNQDGMRVLIITANRERMTAFTHQLKPRWSSTFKNKEVMLLHTGEQLILSSAKNDSTSTLTIVSQSIKQ